MRKFAWLFMAATTVAGFTACSNVEDEPLLPGMGGDGNGGTTPSVVITDTIYTFDNIEADYVPINELCPGWTHEIVSPSDDDRTWQSKTHQSEKYIQATAHDGKGSNAGKTYDLWMFTPALNVKDAPNKVFSFYSEGAYWQSTSSLEVYVLNEPKSTASAKELLSNVRIATEADGQYKWIASGDISLEGKGDTVYVAFRYQAQGGASNSTTYCIDDFAFGRAQVEHAVDGGGDTPDPTPDVDWSSAVSVADALQIANDESVTVKGYVVGCIKNKPSKTSYKTFDEAKQAGDIEWAGDAEFTGYTQVFIADNAGETDGSKCILLDINDTADAKALKELAKLEGHPERIGMAVSVKGVRKNRYGLPGVREISAYKVGE